MCHSNCHYNGNSIPILVDIQHDISIYYDNLISASGFNFVDERQLDGESVENKTIYYQVQYSAPSATVESPLKLRTYGSYNFYTNLSVYND